MRGQEGPVDPGRRTLLRTATLLAGLGAAATLTGCRGIRLEDDAPHLPLPVRHPLDAEAALLRLLSDLRDLTALTAAGTTAAVTALSPLHQTQAETLRDALLRGGVPGDLVAAAQPALSTAGGASATTGTPPASAPTASPPTSATATTGGGDRPPVPPTEAAHAERAALDLARAAPLMACSPELRPTIVAVLAQRATVATRLGAAPDWDSIAPADPRHAAEEATAVDTAATAAPTSDASTAGPNTAGADTAGPTAAGSPTGATDDTSGGGTASGSHSGAAPAHPVPAETAAGLLTPARATAYAMEVVAGQIEASRTANAKATLAQLRQTIAELEDIAGDQAPEPELGYALPAPVTTSSAAVALARTALVAHRAAVATATASPGEASLTPAAGLHLVRWLSDADRWALAWGGPAQPFPGMSNAPAPSATAPTVSTAPTGTTGTTGTTSSP
ncbi:MAG: hypothetical protein LWW86_14200 [Micrococcales bacterium]|nr:hypothetical protein [Micrococcales bacterium]